LHRECPLLGAKRTLVPSFTKSAFMSTRPRRDPSPPVNNFNRPIEGAVAVPFVTKDCHLKENCSALTGSSQRRKGRTDGRRCINRSVDLERTEQCQQTHGSILSGPRPHAQTCLWVQAGLRKARLDELGFIWSTRAADVEESLAIDTRRQRLIVSEQLGRVLIKAQVGGPLLEVKRTSARLS